MSRKFVCARLLTYEDAEEAEFLKSLFTGRSGELENTTFAILAPDGKTKLARAGRGPDFLFGRGPRAGGDAEDLVKVLEGIAKKHPGDKQALRKTPPLPLLEDVRTGINVAACDRQLLVVTIGTSETDLAATNEIVAKAAWSEDGIGRYVYATTTKPDELKPIEDVPKKAKVIVVEPDTFGRKGKVLASVDDVTKEGALDAALAKAQEAWDGPRALTDHRAHVRQGKREGVHWETEIPVTDPGKPPGRRGPPGGGR